MNYWLFKSEPDNFSIDDLQACKKEPWDGVRNYQARNFMRDQCKKEDLIFFYHSSCKEPGIVGLAKIAKNSYPDHTSWNKNSKYFDPKSSEENPRWFMVDIAFVQKFPRTISLRELKKHSELQELQLLKKGNRLSIMPVEKEHYDYICSLV